MASNGYILDIDTKFIQNLERADRALRQSVSAANDLTDRFTQMVNSTSNYSLGVQNVLNVLNKIKGVQIDPATGLLKMGTEARNTAEGIELLKARTEDLKARWVSLSKEIGKKKKGPAAMQIVSDKDLTNINALQTAIANINGILSSASGNKKIGANTQQQLIEQRKLYSDLLKEAQLTDAQRLESEIRLTNGVITEANKRAEAVIKEKKREVDEAIKLANTANAKSPSQISNARSAIASARQGLDPNINAEQAQIQALDRALERLGERYKATQTQKEIFAEAKTARDLAKTARGYEEVQRAAKAIEDVRTKINPDTKKGQAELQRLTRAYEKMYERVSKVASDSENERYQLALMSMSKTQKAQEAAKAQEERRLKETEARITKNHADELARREADEKANYQMALVTMAARQRAQENAERLKANNLIAMEMRITQALLEEENKRAQIQQARQANANAKSSISSYVSGRNATTATKSDYARMFDQIDSANVKLAISLSKSASGIGELTKAYNALEAAKKDFVPKTKAEEIQLQQLDRAFESTKKKIDDLTRSQPSAALNFASSAVSQQDLLQAQKYLDNALKGGVTDPAMIRSLNDALDNVKKKLLEIQQMSATGDAKKKATETNEQVKYALALSRTAKSSSEVARAQTALRDAMSMVDESTKMGQVQMQALRRAYERFAQTSASTALANAKNARTIGDMKRALKGLENAKLNININTKQGKRELSAINLEINRIKRELKNASLNSENFKGALSKLKQGIGTAFGLQAIRRFVDSLVRIHAEFEKINISLKVLIGNSAQAEYLWTRITNLALKSPFTIQQLATATKQMAAYRVESDKLYSSTKMLADISAGLGVEMSRLILAYGQVKAANFLRGTELRQFSEAGIDMLGQLAAYFSEVEKKAVSAADVFERISKRQVLFEDVDAVLRRVTSVGGAFYEMQEKQAQTLAGQISNLKDAVQIMFHEIGTNSHGLIMHIVKALRTMLENWEKWARILVPISAGLIGIKTAGMAMKALSPVFMLVGAALNKLGVTARWATIQMAKLQAITPIGWIGIAASVLTGVGLSIFSSSKLVEESSDTIVESSSEIARIFEEKAQTIEEAGKKIVAYTSHLNRLKKEQEGLEKTDIRYIKNANTIEQITAARSGVVAELTGKNIDLAGSIGAIIDSEKDLIDWYRKGAQEYAQQAVIAESFDVTANNSKVLRDYDAAFNRLYSYSGEGWDAAAGKYADQFKQALEVEGETLKAWVDVGYKYVTEYTALVDKIRKEEQTLKHATFSGYGAIARRAEENLASLRSQLLELDPSGKGLLFGKLQTFLSAKQTLDELSTSTRNAWMEMHGVRRVEDLTEENISEIISDYSTLIKTMDEIPNAAMIVKNALSEAFGFDWVDPPFMATGWQARYNDYIDAAENAIGATAESMEALSRAFSKIKSSSTTQKSIIEQLKNTKKTAKETIDAWNSYTPAQRTSEVMRFTQEDYDQAEKLKKFAEYLLAFFGGDKEKSDSGIRSMLSSITEVHKAFKSLQKTMSDPTAKQGAWTKYRDMLKESLDKMGVDIDSFIGKVGDLTSEDSVVAALEELKTYAKNASDKVAIEKAIGQFTWELKVEKDTKAFEDAMAETEKLIEGYQLGVELDKLHIPKDFAQEFFDIDINDLPELRMQIMAQFEGLDLGTEEWKKINDTLQKVDELEAKAQQERLKKYVEYTRNVVGERGKILMEEFHQLQEIAETFTVTDKMALDKGIILPSQLDVIHSYGETISTMLKHTDEDILQWSAGLTSQQLTQLRLLQQELEIYQKDAEDAVRRDTAEKLSKQDFGIFKEGEVFERVFSDVENASDKLIELTLSKLREFKEIWSGTDVSELSEVLEKIAQLESELAKDSSKSYVKKATEDLSKAIRGKGDYAVEFSKRDDGSSVWENKAESDKLRYNDYNEFREALEEELAIREDIVNKASIDLSVAELKYEKLLENAKATDDEKSAAKAELETRKSDLSTAKQRLDVVVQTLSVDKNRREAMEKESERLSKSLELANDLYDAFKGMAAVFAEEDSIGMTFADMGAQMANTVVNTIMLQIQLQSATVAATTFGAAMQSAMGIIGWIVMGVQLLTMALTAAFKAHDKALQNQIDDEAKRVENLKKAYEDLEEAIEKAYTAANIGKYTREANANLQDQIDATKKMIELEEDKKKTDDSQVQSWKDDIEALQDKMRENIKDAFSSVTAGILDDVLDASNTFVGAWYDAFKETGDGMSGLKDTFKDMLLDMLKQQASMNVMGKYVKQYQDWLNKYIDIESGDEIFSKEDAEDFASRVKETLPAVNEELEGYFEAMSGILEQFDTGELSGLQKGIQGITEDQAEVLASYWNSCRYLLANIDNTLTKNAEAVLGMSSGPNSLIEELKKQTVYLMSIDNQLKSIITFGGTSTHGGSYVKVSDQ